MDQLAQAHKTSMTLLAKAEHFASFITAWATKERQQVQSIEAGRMASAGARTMEAFQRGLLTLDRLQNDGRQTVVVQHLQQVKVAEGGQAVVTGSAKTKGRKRGGGRRK